ncbi:MAG: hypothetical protein GY714_12920 [Desulfobacterales bacterium]|nr:hypothetical protein [Desulfobacterales bacterium]
MSICSNCKKPILNKVSGKYTCSCGKVIQISNESNLDLKSVKYKNLDTKFKDKIFDSIEYIILSILTVFILLAVISLYAWDTNFPELFNSAEQIWGIILYILLVFFSLIEFSLIMVIFFGLKNQKISSKKAKILAFNSFLLLFPIFELLAV